MAILITLTVITLLMAMALELNRRARSEISMVAVSRDKITLSAMVSSGMNAAFAILIHDKNESEIDSIQEDWADPEKIKTILSGISFKPGEVTLKISDERSRLQVNALVNFPEGREFNEHQRLVWERYLTNATAEHEFPDDMNPTLTILYSLKDWIDSGDDEAITGLSGAESDYYQDLDPPYTCRNGPIPMVEELLQVQGITPELYHGMGEESPGIRDFITVNGISEEKDKKYTYNGKININTADVPVLQTLLPEENQDLALAISDYRSEKSDEQYTNDLNGATWYKNVPGCGDITIKPELITTMSDLYRVELTAKLNGIEINRTVIVQRTKDSKTNKYICKVLKSRPE